MKNIQTKVEGTTLTITVDLTKDYGPSKSGKTIIVAGTEGNQKVGDFVVGLTVYKYPQR